MEIIDKQLLDNVSAQAKTSPRLRMNYNFHESLDDLCHRMLNAVELSVIFECKQGPFVPHEEEGVLKVDSL